MKNKPSPLAAARPSLEEARRAVQTLIEFVGEDPAREGLRDTPQRVVRAFEEYCRGYGADVGEILSKTFGNVGGYGDPVLVKNIAVTSHCEHHLAPFVGYAHIAYVPDGRVVGLSKLARLVDAYAGRLQTQERLTQEIAVALETHLKPKGVAVLIEAEHFCMKMRGVREAEALTVTTRFLGSYEKDAAARAAFLQTAHG